MPEPSLVEILDAILALVEEIRVTGTVSLENLAGVKSLVGEIGGCNPGRMEQLRADFEAQIPRQRATEEAYRKAGEVSQADLRYEVRAGEPEARPTAPRDEQEQAAWDEAWAEADWPPDGIPSPHRLAAFVATYNALLAAVPRSSGAPAEDTEWWLMYGRFVAAGRSARTAGR